VIFPIFAIGSLSAAAYAWWYRNELKLPEREKEAVLYSTAVVATGSAFQTGVILGMAGIRSSLMYRILGPVVNAIIESEHTVLSLVKVLYMFTPGESCRSFPDS